MALRNHINHSETASLVLIIQILSLSLSRGGFCLTAFDNLRLDSRLIFLALGFFIILFALAVFFFVFLIFLLIIFDNRDSSLFGLVRVRVCNGGVGAGGCGGRGGGLLFLGWWSCGGRCVSV